MATFIDANVLIRHIAADHPVHSPAAKQLIAEIEAGQLAVWTTDLIIAEVVWVLTSRSLYSMSRNLVQDTLIPIIELQSLHLDGKRLYRRVFEIFVSTNVDFIDAVHAARVEQLDPPHLFSFDRDYDRVPSVVRIEPTTEQ
ncbi:MAG TPA: PIN domain-containing protein [Thermomicrobiales bacterium]|nr:PIN domain-containing protein [Thermomicrobiales bacterium]